MKFKHIVVLNLIGEPNGQHQKNYIDVFPLRKLLKHRYQFKGSVIKDRA